MKNFLKSHSAAIIGLVLLSIIAVLTVLLTQGNTVYSSPLTKDDLEPISDRIPLPDNNETPAPNYEKTLPKSAAPSDTYLYTQTLCGMGDITLCAAHRTPFGLYVVAETDCRNGDIEARKRSVGVLKIDSSGNLLESFSLDTGSPLLYVASKMTAQGLLVVTRNESKTVMQTTLLSYDLTEGKTSLLSYAEDVEVYATGDGYLLFCSGKEGGVLYEYTESGYRFFSLPAISVVKVFEYADRYAVFVNTDLGYGECDVSKKTFAVTKEYRLSSGILLDVLPIEDEGQKLIAIVSDDGLVAKKLDAKSYDLLESRKVGTYKILGVGTDGQKVYLTVSGAVSGIVEIDAALSCAYTLTDIGFLPTVLFDCYYDGEAFFILTGGKEKTALLKITKTNTQTIYLPETKNALLCPHPNGTFCIVASGTFGPYEAIDLYGLSI